MPPNLRDALRTIEYSPEGVSPTICGLMDNTLQLEDVDIWVWLKLIKPKKDSLVSLQKLTELFTICGQWADLAGTCWWQDLPMLLSTSIEKAFEWKHPHAERSLNELAQWLGTYVGVDPTRALINIEAYFVHKQSNVCYNETAQRVLNARKGQKYTSLHIPTPVCPPCFWGSPSTSDDNLSLDRQGGGPPRSQPHTDVPLTGPPTRFCSHCRGQPYGSRPRQLPLL
ncbi:hypothetical protein K439DRAFT_1613679 [Ramaria rubella]|nr:hypothetical protein K439DRAFT_1613679 [Ramaria rubella]